MAVGFGRITLTLCKNISETGVYPEKKEGNLLKGDVGGGLWLDSPYYC